MTPTRALFLVPFAIACLTGCEEREESGTSGSGGGNSKTVGENIDAQERKEARKLKAVKDPIKEEIAGFQEGYRKLLAERRFDELEKAAEDFRTTKETFRDGTWKLHEFYAALELPDEAETADWKRVGEIHEAWIAAKPESITAHVAHAAYLVGYAWHARGNGYASSVTEKRAMYFEKRLESALKVLVKSREFQQKDPMWWNAALTTALGQGWPEDQYDQLVAEAAAYEPTFYWQDNQRAYSLLPRWYGEDGDWEAYALEAAERKGGLGAESYARIVINLQKFYGNIFRESKASWPKTKEGLQQLRKKYPDSLTFINQSALLATMASDQAFAKEMYDLLGDTYLPEVFPRKASFAHYRNWARTGSW